MALVWSLAPDNHVLIRKFLQANTMSLAIHHCVEQSILPNPEEHTRVSKFRLGRFLLQGRHGKSAHGISKENGENEALHFYCAQRI